MHNTLLSALLHVHVSTLLGHPQGDSNINIHKYHCTGFLYAFRSIMHLGVRADFLTRWVRTYIDLTFLEFSDYHCLTLELQDQFLASLTPRCTVDLKAYKKPVQWCFMYSITVSLGMTQKCQKHLNGEVLIVKCCAFSLCLICLHVSSSVAKCIM
jgi:hypothetical protein